HQSYLVHLINFFSLFGVAFCDTLYVFGAHHPLNLHLQISFTLPLHKSHPVPLIHFSPALFLRRVLPRSEDREGICWQTAVCFRSARSTLLSYDPFPCRVVCQWLGYPPLYVPNRQTCANTCPIDRYLGV